MLHFKLFSLDGIVGLSPIEHQAETMGLAKAGQQWSARFMRKGGFTGGYVIYEQFLTKAQQAQVMEKFPDVRKADADDIGKMAILQGNPKIVPAGISQKDAQFIESQQFGRKPWRASTAYRCGWPTAPARPQSWARTGATAHRVYHLRPEALHRRSRR